MSIEGILVGLLAIGAGAAWAFFGLRFFAILLPIWAFFFGLTAGIDFASNIFSDGIIGTTISWGIGLVFGLVLALISFFWYYAAIVILAGAVGYSLGVGFFEYFGFGTGVIAIVVGLILGALFAIGTFLLGVPVLLVMIFSAFSGAAAIVNGVLILFNQVKLESIDVGIFGSLLHQGILGTVAFLVIGAAGLLYQLRDVGQTITSIDRSAYSY